MFLKSYISAASAKEAKGTSKGVRSRKAKEGETKKRLAQGPGQRYKESWLQMDSTEKHCPETKN
jgi:hypothetical protein